MRIIYLYNLLFILCFSYVTYGQDNQQTNNNMKMVSTQYKPTTTTSAVKSLVTQNDKQEDSNSKNDSKNNDNTDNKDGNIDVNSQAIINEEDLPDKVKNVLVGFKTLEEFEKKHKNDKDQKNIECMKTLLSNIYYPNLYLNKKQYFHTVCNENTNIEALKYLRNQIETDLKKEKKEDRICYGNGPNYTKILSIIKLNYLMSCIKDDKGDYCYNYYEELLGDSDKTYYYNKLGNRCYEIEEKDFNLFKNKLPFCLQVAIFANYELYEIIKNEEINLEVFYNDTSSFLLKAKKEDEHEQMKTAIISSCRGEQFHNYFTNELISDSPDYKNAENLIKFVKSSDASLLMVKKIYLLNIFIVMIIVLHILI